MADAYLKESVNNRLSDAQRALRAGRTKFSRHWFFVRTESYQSGPHFRSAVSVDGLTGEFVLQPMWGSDLTPHFSVGDEELAKKYETYFSQTLKGTVNALRGDLLLEDECERLKLYLSILCGQALQNSRAVLAHTNKE